MLFPYMKNICHVTTNLDLSMMQTIFWDSFWRISTINKRKLFSYQITDANAFFDSLLILIYLIRFSATRTQTNCYVCHETKMNINKLKRNTVNMLMRKRDKQNNSFVTFCCIFNIIIMRFKPRYTYVVKIKRPTRWVKHSTIQAQTFILKITQFMSW